MDLERIFVSPDFCIIIPGRRRVLYQYIYIGTYIQYTYLSLEPKIPTVLVPTTRTAVVGTSSYVMSW